MIYRTATTSDKDAVSRLVNSLCHFFVSEPNASPPKWLQESLTTAAFRKRFLDPEYFNVVAENETGILGYIAIKNGNHLYHLFVDEAHHGRGIAQGLWHYCKESLGINTCMVRSSLYAVPVYKRFGFVITGTVAYKDGVGFQTMNYIGSTPN